MADLFFWESPVDGIVYNQWYDSRAQNVSKHFLNFNHGIDGAKGEYISFTDVVTDKNAEKTMTI